jgi:hypothetical protein
MNRERICFALLFAVTVACKTASDGSAVQNAPTGKIPADQTAGVAHDDLADMGIDYSLDNESLWGSPAQHFTDACGQEATVWNKIVGSEYPKKGDFYDPRYLPPPQTEWDTVLGILNKVDTNIPTFIQPYRSGDKRYTGEEIPDKETFARAMQFLKKVGSLGVLGTKSGRTRDKVIHSSGSVAKISFVPDLKVTRAAGFPYTGILQQGAPCGFIRAGLAVSNARHPYTPGIAIKFYINSYPDGNPAKRYPANQENPQSTNVLAMYSLDGQPSTNFFQNSFSNIIEYPTRPEMKLGASYFTASLIAMGAKPNSEESDPTVLSVDELGQFAASGHQMTGGKAPFRLTFKPTQAATELYGKGENNADVRQVLLKFKPGKILFDVYATDDRTPHGSPGMHVGWIVQRTEFKASSYSDQLLHFRHVKRIKNPRFK